jgi:hypothetical protein
MATFSSFKYVFFELCLHKNDIFRLVCKNK